jgi:ABC-type nitrate/sulfonate/bicarbonate transport system substrate-binding protein
MSNGPLYVPTPFDRRRFLRVGATGLGAVLGARVLAACGGDDASSPVTTVAGVATTSAASEMPAELVPVSVGMGWISNVEYAGAWLALANGFYAEEGIDARYLSGGPNAPAPPVVVAAGDAQIGVAASMTQLLDAIGQDNDFVVFATQYQTSPGAVLSLADKPIRTPEDLVGITFLGQEGVDILIDAVLDIAGLPKEYTFIPAGFTPDPLVEGQGDAYSCFLVNQPITLEQRGLVEDEDFVVTTWAELGLPSYANLHFAQRSYLESNRDEVVRFARATIKGWELNERDPNVGAQLAVEDFGVDLGLDIAQQTRQNELQIPLMKSALTAASGLMRLDPEIWDGPMGAAYKASGRDVMPPAATTLDLTILDEVYGDATTLLS